MTKVFGIGSRERGRKQRATLGEIISRIWCRHAWMAYPGGRQRCRDCKKISPRPRHSATEARP